MKKRHDECDRSGRYRGADDLRPVERDWNEDDNQAVDWVRDVLLLTSAIRNDTRTQGEPRQRWSISRPMEAAPTQHASQTRKW